MRNYYLEQNLAINKQSFERRTTGFNLFTFKMKQILKKADLLGNEEEVVEYRKLFIDSLTGEPIEPSQEDKMTLMYKFLEKRANAQQDDGNPCFAATDCTTYGALYEYCSGTYCDGIDEPEDKSTSNRV